LLTSSNDRSKLLLALQIDWESLVIERINTRPGSKKRYDLDFLYARVLPTIVAIGDAVDDQEINRLIKMATSQLKQRIRP